MDFQVFSGFPGSFQVGGGGELGRCWAFGLDGFVRFWTILVGFGRRNAGLVGGCSGVVGGVWVVFVGPPAVVLRLSEVDCMRTDVLVGWAEVSWVTEGMGR